MPSPAQLLDYYTKNDGHGTHTHKKNRQPRLADPAPGNEQNYSVKRPSNETIKNRGNSRSAEDDLPFEKQPYRDKEFNEEDLKEDFNDDPDEQSFK